MRRQQFFSLAAAGLRTLVRGDAIVIHGFTGRLTQTSRQQKDRQTSAQGLEG